MLSPILVGILIFSMVIFLYSLFSHRLERSIITGPIIFLSLGLLVSPDGFDFLSFGANSELVLTLSELALVLILFSDAARIDFRALKDYPLRLLLIGLPFTIAFGAALAITMFTSIALPEAALIGAILAPTDAGLGQAIVNSEKVPQRIRQALNVESGLNDGGAIPLFAFFLVLAQAEVDNIPTVQWVAFALEQIGIGILAGLAVGAIGGYLIDRSIERGLIKGRFQWIGFLALALTSYVAATALGGSGFIAAFMGGIGTSLVGKHVGESIIEFTSTIGEVFSLLVFFVFGVIAAAIMPGVTWLAAIYAVASLTVVRMVPVALCMVKTRLHPESILFMGWFGPRGLASIVLLLITLNEAPDIPGLQTVGVVVSLTVLFSVFAHGITAMPWIDHYARTVSSLPADAPEKKEVTESPTRRVARVSGMKSR